MIFSACRINRECREKIPTKINNKQDIVTCWDFCRSLVRLVLNTTHTSIPTIRNMGISIIMNMYLEQIPRDMYKVKILKGFKHLMMNKYCYIWSLMEYEMYIQWRMGQCLMYETVLFIFDLSLAWFDYRGLLYKKWKNDGFSMPLKLFVQLLSIFSIFICYDKQLFKKKTFLNTYMYVWKCMMIELFSYIVWQLSAVTDF